VFKKQKWLQNIAIIQQVELTNLKWNYNKIRFIIVITLSPNDFLRKVIRFSMIEGLYFLCESYWEVLAKHSNEEWKFIKYGIKIKLKINEYIFVICNGIWIRSGRISWQLEASILLFLSVFHIKLIPYLLMYCIILAWNEKRALYQIKLQQKQSRIISTIVAYRILCDCWMDSNHHLLASLYVLECYGVTIHFQWSMYNL